MADVNTVIQSRYSDGWAYGVGEGWERAAGRSNRPALKGLTGNGPIINETYAEVRLRTEECKFLENSRHFRPSSGIFEYGMLIFLARAAV